MPNLTEAIAFSKSKEVRGRVNVTYNGQTFLWVDHFGGEYSANAHVYDAIKGYSLFRGLKSSREEAIWEALSDFEIRHLGRFVTYDLENVCAGEIVVHIDRAELKQAMEAALDRHYARLEQRRTRRAARKA